MGANGWLDPLLSGWVQFATIELMTVNLHVRDVPASVHETLVRRAERKGMSLRQYTIEVLSEHCSLPTVEMWLDELGRLQPVETFTSAAEAVEEARTEDDLAVLGADPGS